MGFLSAFPVCAVGFTRAFPIGAAGFVRAFSTEGILAAGWDFNQVFWIGVALAAVIGMLFLTFAATKWLNKKFRFGGLYGVAKGIKIIESISVAQDKQLIIVRAGQKLMLLGVTPGSISKICDLVDDDLSDTSEEETQNATVFDNFKKVLAEKTGLFKNNPKRDDLASSAAESGERSGAEYGGRPETGIDEETDEETDKMIGREQKDDV
jgi:flagellar biogenesis protein FliO